MASECNDNPYNYCDTVEQWQQPYDDDTESKTDFGQLCGDCKFLELNGDCRVVNESLKLRTGGGLRSVLNMGPGSPTTNFPLCPAEQDDIYCKIKKNNPGSLRISRVDKVKSIGIAALFAPCADLTLLPSLIVGGPIGLAVGYLRGGDIMLSFAEGTVGAMAAAAIAGFCYFAHLALSGPYSAAVGTKEGVARLSGGLRLACALDKKERDSEQEKKKLEGEKEAPEAARAIEKPVETAEELERLKEIANGGITGTSLR